jgi:hypothetical protein
VKFIERRLMVRRPIGRACPGGRCFSGPRPVVPRERRREGGLRSKRDGVAGARGNQACRRDSAVPVTEKRPRRRLRVYGSRTNYAEIDLPMKSEAKNQLEEVLGAYDARHIEEERAIAAKRAADAAFPTRFATLRAETLRPAIQEFIDVLLIHGHGATATEQEESLTTTDGFSHAAISLRISPRPFAHKSPEPNKPFIEIMFSANRSERKITVSSTNTTINSNGNVGKRGEYEIDTMTADIVAEQVIRTLEEALR